MSPVSMSLVRLVWRGNKEVNVLSKQDKTENAESIDYKQLLGKNKMDINGKAEDFSSCTFWYYTSIYTASEILKSTSFYASSLNLMNDKAEAKRHSAIADNVHALCFCNSNTEKIPKWYMYAGITGQGVAIGLTPAVMKTFIKSISSVENLDKETKLECDSGFDMQIGRVYYKDSEQRINFRNKWYQIEKTGCARFYKDNYFVKNYPWEYEKEFRIIIKTKEPCRRVKISFSEDLIPKLKIRFAPEIKKEYFPGLLQRYEGLRRYYESQIQYSSLDIEMSLISRNIDAFGDYVKKIKNDDPVEYKRIRKDIFGDDK